MALTGVLRPGFVQLRVLDIDEALAHYRDRLGLELVGTEADGRVYLRGYDEFDRHSVILRPADEPGIDVLGFKVASEEALDEFGQRIEKAGLGTTVVPAGEQPGLGRRIRFVVPTGHQIDLYSSIEQSADAPGALNPDVWKSEPRGMRAQRFDHCLLYGPDIDDVTRVFVDVLDFSVTERIDTPDGTLAVWLSCSNKAHDIAFVNHEQPGKFHHAAFFLESWSDIGHAADVIARYDVARDIGPTRHGITRGQTIYFFDPSGNRNEVFSGGYTYYPDNPIRLWSADQAAKGIFYYEKELNDRFLAVVT